MAKINWRNSIRCEARDERVAARLKKLILKVYKYAESQGLNQVNFLTMNVDHPERKDDTSHSCYLTVRAERGGLTVVDDCTWIKYIEWENNYGS